MHLVAEPPPRQSRRHSVLGQIILVLVGLQLLFFSGFAYLKLPTASSSNLLHFGRNQLRTLAAELPTEAQSKAVRMLPVLASPREKVRYSSYCCLAPLAVLEGYVLGPALAVTAVSLYLLAGLLGPLLGVFPFAAGGGMDYYLQPGFGYLVGSVAGAWLCGRITQGRRTSVSQLLGACSGLLVIHLSGAGYLFGAYLYFYLVEGSKTYLQWQPWIFQYLRNLTWYALPYDVVLSVAAIALSFPLRWIADHLISSDRTPPPYQVRYDRKRLEELVQAQQE